MGEANLQDQYAPNLKCFGCGPANEKGLRIKSIVRGDEVVAEWTPQEHHLAFEGVLSGGIVGALLDCHSNWTATHHLMRQRKLDHPPPTVTAEYSIALKRPCPMDGPVLLKAHVVAGESSGDRVVVEATLEAAGKLRATCRGTFIAVQPGHPAYHRW